MIKIVLLTGALSMPLKRSLDIGGFGDTLGNDPLVPTVPVTTTKNQRNYIQIKNKIKLSFLGIIEISCKEGFLSLSVYDSQVALLISICIAVISSCASGGYFCIKKRNQPIDEGCCISIRLFLIYLFSPT